MTVFLSRVARIVAGCLAISLLAMGVESSLGQTQWLEDASGAKIPTGPIKGEINGRPATFTKGRISRSGGMSLGESEFPHYTLYLSDTENALSSRFSAHIVVAVRSGESPDGRVFRSDLAPRETRAGLRGDGYWIPELYSVFMTSRRGEEFESGTAIVVADGKKDLLEQDFTGRVEIDRRKGARAAARLYICYNDKKKSWIAGSVDLEIE